MHRNYDKDNHCRHRSFISLGNTAFAQKEKVEGTWLDAEKIAKIQIYKATDGKYWGKIVWLKEPMKDGKPKVDEKNDNPRLRTTPLLNMPILRAFSKVSETSYEDGKIYDPKSGNLYSCVITVRNPNELGIRGYKWGMKMIGRTATWTRAD